MDEPPRDIYILEEAMKQAEALFAKQGQNGFEAMGLLLGQPRSWHGSTYVVADQFITAANTENPVQVRFLDEAFPSIAKQINAARGSIVVGWIHSHPSYGCFLSATDVKTHRAFFAEPFNVAVVVDPLKTGSDGKMEKKAFKVDDNGTSYREVGLAVYRKKAQAKA